MLGGVLTTLITVTYPIWCCIPPSPQDRPTVDAKARPQEIKEKNSGEIFAYGKPANDSAPIINYTVNSLADVSLDRVGFGRWSYVSPSTNEENQLEFDIQAVDNKHRTSVPSRLVIKEKNDAVFPNVIVRISKSIANEGDTVILNASDSWDRDVPDTMDKLKFNWSYTPGPKDNIYPVNIQNRYSSVAWFKAPSVRNDTQIRLILSVKDTASLTSVNDFNVTVLAPHSDPMTPAYFPNSYRDMHVIKSQYLLRHSEKPIIPVQLPGTNNQLNDTKPQIALDKFGIRMIYQSNKSGDSWFMNMNNPYKDTRSKPPTAMYKTQNNDGSWKIKNDLKSSELESGPIWYSVFADGYDGTRITSQNHKIYYQRGYMHSPKDWKNVEMTAYFKVNNDSNNENLLWYIRGGIFNKETRCEGTSYTTSMNTEGTVNVGKKQYHSFSVYAPPNKIEPILGKWIGLKFVVYNSHRDNKTTVNLEAWADLFNNNGWTKIYNFTDSGGWGTGGDLCNGSKDQIIAWGGPDVHFRWDQQDVDIRNLSVREIQPP
jgi:hypothetical protein